VASYDILGCENLLHVPDPIGLTINADGITTGAALNGPIITRARQFLANCARQDQSRDIASTAADTE
jgi:hypothetical protein